MAQVRRWLRPVLICGVLLGLYFAVPVTTRMPTQDYVLRVLVAVLFFALLAILVVRQLRLQIEDETGRRVDGLVVVVLAVVLGFSLAFYVLQDRNPGQVPGLETRLDALYFAMTTLLTVGYGDIHAEGQAARVLVLVQMVFNVVFIASAANVLSNRVRTVVTERAQARAVARGEEPPRRRPEG
jgi:voltage-gated potassium channel Kch